MVEVYSQLAFFTIFCLSMFTFSFFFPAVSFPFLMGVVMSNLFFNPSSGALSVLSIFSPSLRACLSYCVAPAVELRISCFAVTPPSVTQHRRWTSSAAAPFPKHRCRKSVFQRPSRRGITRTVLYRQVWWTDKREPDCCQETVCLISVACLLPRDCEYIIHLPVGCKLGSALTGQPYRQKSWPVPRSKKK